MYCLTHTRTVFGSSAIISWHISSYLLAYLQLFDLTELENKPQLSWDPKWQKLLKQAAENNWVYRLDSEKKISGGFSDWTLNKQGWLETKQVILTKCGEVSHVPTVFFWSMFLCNLACRMGWRTIQATGQPFCFSILLLTF